MNPNPPAHPVETPSLRQRPQHIWALFTLAALLLGIGSGYYLWGRTPASRTAHPAENEAAAAASDSSRTAPSEAQADMPRQKPSAVDLARQINPPEGYTLGVAFGDLGPQLVSLGAIDQTKFAATYRRAGQPLTEAQTAVLQQDSDETIVFNKQNAYFLLNFFWALGLTNQNPILTEGPMMKYGAGQIGRFASTGGWTIGSKPAAELYASAPLIPLTPAQQARLERVAQNVYRPCCNNPAHFPDCNHGMAMLGMLTLLASQDASEAEMFKAAKYANAFWYPQQSFELALYFQVAENAAFEDVDAARLVSANFSSGAGFQVVHQLLAANGMLEPAPGGGNGCGV